jgi:hypothetical protein
MRSIERFERFWHDMVLVFPWGTEVNGAVVSCYPEVPISQFNHAADIDVMEDEAEDLLEEVMRHFVSKRSPDVRFRTTALTRPRSFSVFLRNHGFARSKEDEESAMVFKGKHVEDKLNPKIKVKEISESEVDVYSKLIFTIFEMPSEWKKGVDRFILEIMRKGAKCYLAYVGKKPVGTSALLSFMKTGGSIQRGNSENIQKTRHWNNPNSTCRNRFHQRRKHTSYIIHGKERKPRTGLPQNRIQNRSYSCLVCQTFEQTSFPSTIPVEVAVRTVSLDSCLGLSIMSSQFNSEKGIYYVLS